MRNPLSKFQSIRCGRAATLKKIIFQIHLKETVLGLQYRFTEVAFVENIILYFFGSDQSIKYKQLMCNKYT